MSGGEQIELYLVCRDGSVSFAEELGEACVQLVKEKEAIIRVFLSDNQSELIVISQSLFLTIYDIMEGRVFSWMYCWVYNPGYSKVLLSPRRAV